MKIGLHAVYEKSFAKAFHYARDFGFDYVQFDLNVPHFYVDDISGRKIAALQKMSRDYGVGITFHAPGDNVGLFTDQPSIRSGIIDHFKRIIDIAIFLNSHHVTFHPLSPPSFKTADTRIDLIEQSYFDYFRQVFVENVAVLERASCGPLICIENQKLGAISIAGLEQLFQQSNHVALTWDIPKSMESYDKPNSKQHDFFRKHSKHIREIHLHDLDEKDEHLVPGEGKINFEMFRNALTADDRWITIEVRPAHMAARAKEWLLSFAGVVNGGG